MLWREFRTASLVLMPMPHMHHMTRRRGSGICTRSIPVSEARRCSCPKTDYTSRSVLLMRSSTLPCSRSEDWWKHL